MNGPGRGDRVPRPGPPARRPDRPSGEGPGAGGTRAGPGPRRCPGRRPHPRDAGQSTVELALGLPFVVLLVFLVIEVATIGHDQVLLTHAAREAARAAAVSDDPTAARRAAGAAGGLDADRLAVVVTGRDGPGSYVEVQVRYPHRVAVPLVGSHLPDLELAATASMRVER